MSENCLNNQYINQNQFQTQQPQAYAQNPVCNQPYVTMQPAQGTSGVNINIINPQAFATKPDFPVTANNGYYSLYGPNSMPGMVYPANYNNTVQNYTNNQSAAQNPQQPVTQPNTNSADNTNGEYEYYTDANGKIQKKLKTKKITPLTDEYVKSLENYMNNENPKIRMIGVKSLIDKFKEDDGRKTSPHLTPLLNKALKDTSPSIRFLALTALQLGYCAGNDETVQLLKQFESSHDDMTGQENILAADILLKMSTPEKVEVKS